MENNILIIKEDRNSLEFMRYDLNNVDKFKFENKYIPHINYYKIDCRYFYNLGLDTNDIYEAVYHKYIRSDFQPLNKLFNEIERM